MFPGELWKSSCGGWQARQQRLWGVAVWAWQASPGWPDRRLQREAGCIGQASEGGSWRSQWWSCLIGNEVWVWAVWVCTGTCLVHTGMYLTKQIFPEIEWADVYLTLSCGNWYWACGTSIWWYLKINIGPPSPHKVHVVQLVYTGMYVVHTCTFRYIMIPCSLKYFLGSFFVTYDCRTRYSVCVPCILWCYNTESVPLYVSSIHDFVMVHTGTAWHVLLYLVCTSTYRYILNTLFLYIWSRFQMFVFQRVLFKLFSIISYYSKDLDPACGSWCDNGVHKSRPNW